MASSEYYDNVGYPAFGSLGSSAPMRGEFVKIEVGFGKLPDLAGNGGKVVTIKADASGMEVTTTTGTGSIVRAVDPTFTLSDVTTNNASTSQHGWMQKYPGGTTTFLRGDGTFAAPPATSMVQQNRTSNTILVSGDNTTLINYTSGTFTQTITAAATLGLGWFAYLRNSGTGKITLDPNGAETIDGSATLDLDPQEARIMVCDGSAFSTIALDRVRGMFLITPPVTPTAAANVDFLSVFTSVFDDYLIVIDGVRPSADDRLAIRYAVAGSVVSTNNYFTTDINITATASSFISFGSTSTTTAGIGSIAEAMIQNVNHATQPKGGRLQTINQVNATPTFMGSSQWGAFNGGVVTGFRLYWESGANFAAQGSIKVYGLSKK